MPGPKSIYAKDCKDDNFIGVDWFADIDLSKKLPEDWKTFNKEFVPIYLDQFPEKTKITAGLASGMTHTVCKGMVAGSIILVPDGNNHYHVGEVTSEYSYAKGEILPHRRNVSWYPNSLDRSEMSQELQNSTGSIGTVSNITKHAEEIEALLHGKRPATLLSSDETVENPSAFALEQHLEEFLVRNWENTPLSSEFDIYEDEGNIVGQQYPTDTGFIDILAISKDKKNLLVIELKKGRASDNVVGQIQRYMGFVIEELAEKNQKVRGIIIGFEDDLRIQRALKVARDIEFYRYEVNFKLSRA